MYVKGLAHIGIPTKDLAGSLEFYRDLGFEVAGMENEGRENAVAFTGQKGVVFEVYLSEEKQDVPGAVNHIALDVENIEETYLWVKKQGYRITTPGIVCIPDFLGKGTRYFTIEGYNHELIEFNETS